MTPTSLVAQFDALRRANLALWERFGASHGARIGMHSERGPESYDLTFRLAAGHDRVHLARRGGRSRPFEPARG